MKSSPIMLLQTLIEKIQVEINPEFEGKKGQSEFGESVELQVRQQCEPYSDYWDEETPPVISGIENRTYSVTLGIRTDPEVKARGPYSFELVFTGVVACVPEMIGDLPPQVAAQQYGYAMVYGAMREQFITLTSRMGHGGRLLPTVSFMDSGLPEKQGGPEDEASPSRISH